MTSFRVGFITVVVMLAGSAVTGCSNSGAVQETLFDIEVQIDGHPVPDVRVALAPKDGPAEATVLSGVTDHAGIAGMMRVDNQVPSSEVTEYRVVVESLGDWHLASPWSDPDKTPLAVSWPTSEQKLLIELPKKAVKRL